MSHLYVAAAGGKHHWSVLGGICLTIGGGLLGGAVKTVGAWFPNAKMSDRRRCGYKTFGSIAAAVGIVLFVTGLIVG